MLCAEHAQFEQASFDAKGKKAALRQALFSATPSLFAWVAEGDGAIIGYATATIDFSTWSGRKYAYMDCLFVRGGKRGLGVGALLFEEIVAFARTLGLCEVQWQTPAWNVDAARFYRRMAAMSAEKLRFTLAVPGQPSGRQVGWSG